MPTKKPKRRFFTRQFETIFFVILILSVFSILLLFTINDIFPNNGGFTRNIFFVKSVEPDTPAYFIIIDEINPTNPRIPVDWLLHGRGNLSIFNNNQSALWEVESYLNPHHIVKFHVIFIQPEVTISKSAGPFYPTQSYVDNPITVHYIKARPTLTGSMHIVTLLIPLNGTQHLPNLTRDAESGVTYIGERDLIFTQNSVSLKTFDNYTTNAEILFIRRNNSEILSYILKNGNYFSQNSQVFLKAENTLSVNLEYQASNLSGLCWVNTPTQISLWVPNTPKQVLFNGQDLSHTYNPVNQTTTFNIPQNGSLFLSFNPFKSFEQKNPSYESPTSRSQPIFPSTSRTINYGIHPILYFNESNLSSLRSKILTQQPWLNWFLRLESNAIGHLSDNISSLGADNRAEPALNLAFSGVIRQNLTYINKAKQFLLAMDEITAYFSHLRRGRACSHYALAFDMIYPNLSATERAEIAEKLENHTLPLIQKFPALPQNNHIGVVASGIGLSGLVLEKNDWVSLATTGIDTYFSTCFTAEGGNFEGYSYAGYFLESGLKFFYGLKNAGGKNYFANPTFLASIYSSPGNYAMNEYFLGVLIFLFTNLVIVSFLSVYLRHRAYKAKIFFFPTETPLRFSTIKFKNLVLKTHLIIALGLIFGVISSLVSFFLFTNTYIEGYLVGQHAEIANLIPIIEISLIIISIPLLILILSFKFKIQQKIVRRVATFSSNLPPSDIPSLKDSIKISYFPQIFFILIFILIMLFSYVPILEDVVNHIFTEGGSLIDIQNYIIGALNQYIWLFALTFLLYLPFKLIGLYLGGQILSEKLSQPTSDGILMLTIGYLLTLTFIILAIFYLTLTFFYVLN